MAWSWSHTADAERNVEQHIRKLDQKTLIEVYAEWSCAYWDEYGNPQLLVDKMDLARETALCFCMNDAHDIVADAIIERVINHRVCDNGGFHAHICPFGCHTVPFDEPEDDDDLPF